MYFKKWKIASGFLGLLLFSIAGTVDAGATSCWRPTPAQHVEQADIIFFGQLTSRVGSSADNKEMDVEFEVLRAYKGVSGQKVRIRYINDHGALLGWGFQTSQPTLVFASIIKSDNGSAEIGYVDYCSMIPFYARRHLHSGYQGALALLNSR